jgi:hypothetical protein
VGKKRKASAADDQPPTPKRKRVDETEVTPKRPQKGKRKGGAAEDELPSPKRQRIDERELRLKRPGKAKFRSVTPP